MVLGGGFPRLGDDLFRGSNGLLRLLLLHTSGCDTRLFNQFVRLKICLIGDLLRLYLGVCQF